MSIIAAVISFVLSPVGRWVAIGGVSALLVFGAYTKGRWDGRAAYKAKITREIDNAVQKGNAGAADALRKLDAGGLPDSWFRD